MIRRPPRSTRMTHSFPTRRSSDLHGLCDRPYFGLSPQPRSHRRPVGRRAFRRARHSALCPRAGTRRDRRGIPALLYRERQSRLRSEERRVGKECSVSVDLGGRRIIKKQNSEKKVNKNNKIKRK